MKILIVEDETKIAKALKKGLEQESYIVDISYNGEDGLEMALNEEYDAIILDLMLPKLDGSKVCQKLREQKIKTPIIILTAKSELEDKITNLNIGADDYLTKPFSFSELLARIRALIRRSKNESNNKLIANDLVLDLEKQIVSRSNKEIKLSKKEYQILEYLMLNKNRVVTKDKILDHVWSIEAEILPNTIEQYIRYLRKKVEYPFKNKKTLIETIRGFGYKIVD